MKVVVVFSGGMDSTALLEHCLARADQVEAISFDYGQRHKKELEYASAYAKSKNVPHRVIDLTSLHALLQGSALTSNIDVPEGHYAEESMKATVVPNRNMIMLSIAIGYAVSLGFDTVATGVHAGDHAIYPDCRAAFIKAMNTAAEIANYQAVEVYTPFLYLTKGQVAAEGLTYGIDFDKTWTCYKGLDVPCGKCGSCTERAEALLEAQG